MKKRKHPFLKFCLLLIVLTGILLADSGLRIVTTEYALGYAGLPQSFDGYRIVQLSDVHGAEFGKNNTRLLQKVKAAAPDMIAITGDFADGKSDMETLETLLCGLAEIAPVYYVSGNHEWSEGMLPALQTLFEAHGVRYLRNEYLLLERGGESIVLAGVEDPNGPWDMKTPEELTALLRAQYPDKFALLLAHRNDFLEKHPDLPVDLIFCGHAHGGIVRLPFFGGVLGAGFRLFPEHVDSVFESETYDLVVSRGLGNSLPVPRFFNNPEIVCVQLHCN